MEDYFNAPSKSPRSLRQSRPPSGSPRSLRQSRPRWKTISGERGREPLRQSRPPSGSPRSFRQFRPRWKTTSGEGQMSVADVERHRRPCPEVVSQKLTEISFRSKKYDTTLVGMRSDQNGHATAFHTNPPTKCLDHRGSMYNLIF